MHPSSSVVIYRRRMEKDVPMLPQSQRRKMGCPSVLNMSVGMPWHFMLK
uniref:Alternative protein C12orf41 n=1 Tax=Homo sapiens TaxID=9606 RepID=L8E8U3_HUMAN|nr:alternative protein C12orf41 [Homo sapiens]